MNSYFSRQRTEFCELPQLVEALNAQNETPFSTEETTNYLEQLQEEGIVHFADGIVNLM